MGMRIYIENKEVRKFPSFIWNLDDRYLMFLWGINIYDGKVAPVYYPLLSLQRHHLGLTIETPWIRFHFLHVPPFFDFEIATGEFLERIRLNTGNKKHLLGREDEGSNEP